MSEPPKAPEPTMEEILASIRRIIADNARPDDLPPEDLPPDDLLPEDVPGAGPDSRQADDARTPPDAPPAAAPPVPTPLASTSPAAPVPPLADEPDPLILNRMLAADGSVVTLPQAAADAEKPAADEALLLTRPLPPEEPLLLTAAAAQETAAKQASWSKILEAADQASAAGPRPTPARPRWVASLPAAAPPPAPETNVVSVPPGPTPRPTPEAAPGPAPGPERPVGGGARTIEDLVREALEPKLQAWLDQHLQDIVERRVQEEIDRISRLSQKPNPDGAPKP